MDIAHDTAARVMLETLDALTRRAGDELPEQVTVALRLRLQRECEEAVAGHNGSGLSATSSKLKVAYARTRDEIQSRTRDWIVEGEHFDALTPGLQRIYRRGRRRMREAQQDPSAEQMRRWRKRVTDLWHATEIDSAAQPEALRKTARRAHKLADLLGDEHDLHVLRDYVEAHPECFEDGASRAKLVAVIDRRARKLRKKALKRGRKLYKRSPKKFASAIGRGWHKLYSTLPASAPSALSASTTSTARS